MEVTRKNFKESLPLITKSIKNADFLAFDAEFTGLSHGENVYVFDSPQEYYRKLTSNSADFLLIQFGLSAFCWDEINKNYLNESYNFYLFPRGMSRGYDKTFLCQASSLDFLGDQGFDFNKLIREGISYVTQPVETKMRENLIDRQKSYVNNKRDVITIPKENEEQVEDICQKVKEFLDDNKSDEMEIDRCNSFIRRLLFQELEQRFKSEAFVETIIKNNNNRVLKVTRVTSKENLQALNAQRMDKEWEDLNEIVGFTTVAHMISQSGKLLVGHNLFLDIIHTLSHFFRPLPNDYETFKEFTHCMFPKLIDTKHISSDTIFQNEFKSTVLQHLIDCLCMPPFTLPVVDAENGRGYRKVDGKYHEAGYDAYITGLCFLVMHDHLVSDKKQTTHRVFPDSDVLKPFINKIFLSLTADCNMYLNLVGDDAEKSRDHIFFFTFPRDYQRSDINNLFSPFGPVSVYFVSDRSAFVCLLFPENARDAFRTLSLNKNTTIVPYNKHVEYFNKGPEQDFQDEYEVEGTTEIQNMNASTSRTSRDPETPPTWSLSPQLALGMSPSSPDAAHSLTPPPASQSIPPSAPQVTSPSWSQRSLSRRSAPRSARPALPLAQWSQPPTGPQSTSPLAQRAPPLGHWRAPQAVPWVTPPLCMRSGPPPGMMPAPPPGMMPASPPGMMPAWPPSMMSAPPPGTMPAPPPGMMPAPPPGMMPAPPPGMIPAPPYPASSTPQDRKRTASGVFQVEECDRPSKKLGICDSTKNRSGLTNGHRDTNNVNKEKTNSVTIFKESDSWD